MRVPAGHTIQIKKAGSNIVDVPLVLAEDVTLNLTSEFGPIIQGGGNDALTIASQILAPLNKRGISGQFRQQGFQIWKGTQPISFSFNIELNMRTNGREDVYEPARQLSLLTVPVLAENGWGLIPPGPSILSVLNVNTESLESETEDDGPFVNSTGQISIRISNYFYFPQVVVKKVVPIFSRQVDDQGFPVSAKISLEIITTDIANDQMINNMSNVEQFGA